MIAPEKLFENFFDDIKIIPRRLANFGRDAINRMKAASTGDEYSELIDLLDPPVTAFQKELSDVVIALNDQKGDTLTVDQFMAGFGKTMSDMNGVIAHAVGGFGTPAYLKFYPRGISEYTKATKEQMPTLVEQVKEAATKHAAALGNSLAAQLQGFEGTWNTVRDEQQQQKGDVSDGRTERSAARRTVELVLLSAIHSLAAKFPGNVAQCMSFFDFSMLTADKHKTDTPPEEQAG